MGAAVPRLRSLSGQAEEKAADSTSPPPGCQAWGPLCSEGFSPIESQSAKQTGTNKAHSIGRREEENARLLTEYSGSSETPGQLSSLGTPRVVKGREKKKKKRNMNIVEHKRKRQ